MEAERKHLLLAERIEFLLRECLVADRGVLAYMESTLGIFSPEQLDPVISDECHGERESLMDLALDLLNESAEEGDIVDAIREKRVLFLHMLRRAEEMEKQLQKSNPETLMLQGVRIPCVDAETLRQKTKIVDQILEKLEWGTAPSPGAACFAETFSEDTKP